MYPVDFAVILDGCIIKWKYMILVVRKPDFCIYAKTKTQISFAVTAQLVSAFVFATWIVQSLYFLNPKFQASSHLLWLYSLVRVGSGRKSRIPVFSQRGSYGVRLIHIFLTFQVFETLRWVGMKLHVPVNKQQSSIANQTICVFYNKGKQYWQFSIKPMILALN